MLAFSPIKALRNFEYFLFALTLSISCFVTHVFLKHQQLHSFIRNVLVLVLVLPSFLLLLTLVNPYQLEQSWPLILSLMVVNVTVGLLSLTNGFQVSTPFSLLQKIFFTTTALIGAIIAVFVLLVIDLPVFYNFLLLFVPFVFILGVIVLLVSKKGKEVI